MRALTQPSQVCGLCLVDESERRKKKNVARAWKRDGELRLPSVMMHSCTRTQFTLFLSPSHTDILVVTVRGSDYHPGEYRCANAVAVVLWSQLDQPDVSRRGRTELRAMCTPATQNGARTERIPTVFRGGPPPQGMTGQACCHVGGTAGSTLAGPTGYLADVAGPLQVHGAWCMGT